MAYRISIQEAEKMGIISPDCKKKPRHKQLSSKLVNTGEGTPQHLLYKTFIKRFPDIPMEWEKKKLIPGRRFQIDLFIPNKLIIEVDGYQFHRSLGAFKKDRIRQNILAEHGFIVLRYFSKQIFDIGELEIIVQQIASIHKERNT
jgi:very-short-patch-repair endonuclease